MRDRRIVLVHPDYNNKVVETLSIPMGLAYISSYLESVGIKHSCYDFAIDSDKFGTFLKERYDIICVQIHSHETLIENLKFLRRIKQKCPYSTIIIGGIVPSLEYIQLIELNEVDIVVRGEGEITLSQLLPVLQKNNEVTYNNLKELKGIVYISDSKIINNGLSDYVMNLDDLLFPNWHKFNMSKYKQFSIITSRGCPYRCKFCTVPTFYEGRVRVNSPTRVLEELSVLYNEYGMKKFFVLDDTFTLDKKRVREICKLIIEADMSVEWVCLSRIDAVDRETLTLMKLAGCKQISYGIESYNQETLNALNKGLDVSIIDDVIEMTKEVGLRTRCSFIYGLPIESIAMIKHTSNRILKSLPDEIQIYPYMPYDGIELNKSVNELENSMIEKFFGYKKNAFKPIHLPNQINQEELDRVLNECIKKLRKKGYTWIPEDIKAGKHGLEKVVMTEFAPVQEIE